MTLEKTKNLRDHDIVLNEGVDESSAVTNKKQSRLVTMNNWRLSEAGDRIEKRNGYGTAVVGSSTLGAHDVFGYHTYHDSSDNFCQLVIAEDKIWRKVGAAAWATIHTWSSTLTHPVKVMEIQGKQIIITENDNRMILADGTDVQVGITAPATIPTLAESFEATLLDEDMAAIADWTDDDQGGAASTQVTYDSKSTMRLLCAASSGDIARRYRTVSDIGPEYVVNFSIYFNTLGIYPDTDHFELTVYNGRIKLQIRIDKNDLYVYSGSYWVSAGMEIVQDTWLEFKFYINSSTEDDEYVEVYKDGVAYGHYNCSQADTTNAGKTQVELYGDASATDAYIDWMKIGSTSGGNLNGLYRYGITYVRNSGNYPNESNPIKSLVGTATITGAGLDDLTAGGTYAGSKDRNIRVEIDGTGTPDTIKWSDDGGTTWLSKTLALTTTMYLSYGIELTFGATTGHTSGDYWDFTCQAITANPCHQKVTLTSIPTSSDPQVTQRKIYRTTGGGLSYYLIGTLNDNTTTTFVDNVPDSALGASMTEDNDVAPNGDFAIWWDDRLWIADKDENIVYYSKSGVPDAFDTSNRYVSVRYGESDDKITNMIPFKSYLYIMKRNSIYFIRKRDSATAPYGRYECIKGFGNIAPWSLVEASGFLMFASNRCWEIFDGCNVTPFKFSAPLNTTLSTLDKSEADLITSAVYGDKSEVWLSVPDRTGGNSAVTCVCNYLRGKFYTFTFPEVPSCMVEARDINKDHRIYIGTRDGNVYEAESSTNDGGTNVTATARAQWRVHKKDSYTRRLEVEYECPTDKNILVDAYANFDKDTKGQRTLAGKTPTATDQSIRLPIYDYLEFAFNAQYQAFKFTNNEDVGSDVKINWATDFYAPTTRKERKEPD